MGITSMRKRESGEKGFESRLERLPGGTHILPTPHTQHRIRAPVLPGKLIYVFEWLVPQHAQVRANITLKPFLPPPATQVSPSHSFAIILPFLFHLQSQQLWEVTFFNLFPCSFLFPKCPVPCKHCYNENLV